MKKDILMFHLSRHKKIMFHERFIRQKEVYFKHRDNTAAILFFYILLTKFAVFIRQDR